MAVIRNNTARQFNVKNRLDDGSIATVRLAPGLNVVNDDHWAIVGDCKFVADLVDKGSIKVDAETGGDEKDADTKSKSKVVPAAGKTSDVKSVKTTSK